MPMIWNRVRLAVFFAATWFHTVSCVPVPLIPVQLVSAPSAECPASPAIGRDCERRLCQFDRATELHKDCRVDSDCAPVGMRDSQYECLAVNAQWWARARPEMAPLVFGCPFMHTISPLCCVVECEAGRCRNHEEVDGGLVCTWIAPGGPGS